MSTLWKINCMEDKYPGMWHRWYRQQCVAVGWRAEWGYTLDGRAKNHGWARARSALERISVGDHVIVALGGHRLGRLGEITRKRIEDGVWDPLVPPTNHNPDGEMGRRILVRWDMMVGPESRDQVVLLPDQVRLSGGELRPTIAEVRSVSLKSLKRAMNDRANWIGLLSHFALEKALSDFIAAYPHRLEDGLVPHPSQRVREQIFRDRTRSDVLLLDRDERPVVVECKQQSPSVADINQLRHYMRLLMRETRVEPRGILVHGGAAKLRADVVAAADRRPEVEIVRHRLDVEFTACR